MASEDLHIIPISCGIIVKKKKAKSASSSSSANGKLVAGSFKADIEAWLDKNSRAHVFLMYTIKPTNARQFADDEETTSWLWEAIWRIYHKATHGQMIGTENQTENLKIYETLQMLSQGARSQFDDYIAWIFSAFSDNFSSSKNTWYGCILLACFKTGLKRRKAQMPPTKLLPMWNVRNRTWKLNTNSNNSLLNPRKNNPANEELACHYCTYKGHIQTNCRKKEREKTKKPSSTKSYPTSQSNWAYSAKENQFPQHQKTFLTFGWTNYLNLRSKVPSHL